MLFDLTRELKDVKNNLIAWSAYKALRGDTEDSKRLDSLCRKIDDILKEYDKFNKILEELKNV